MAAEEAGKFTFIAPSLDEQEESEEEMVDADEETTTPAVRKTH